MRGATENFQATEDDVCTQCLSALTCGCFEEFAVAGTQAVTAEGKSPTAVWILQREQCSLHLELKLVISQAHWKHRSAEPN